MTNFVFDQNQQDDVVVFPCSATQKQFWLINQLMPQNPAYNIPLGFIAEAGLNVDVLEKAVQCLVERHEVLRLTFHWVDGELEQHLLEEYEFNLARESLPENQALEPYIQAQCQTPFKLADHPAFTAKCVSLADGRQLILFNFHHIIVDHRAVLIFQDELKQAYFDINNGGEPNLEELEVQFGDFVLWREENYPDEELAPLYDFWTQFLQGQSGKLSLPLDRPRPENAVGSGKEATFAFAPNHGQNIVTFAKNSGLSPYIVGLTALKVLLYRYADQSDIVIGSPFTERGLLDELQDVMGCFMNMLPLASVIEGQSTFNALLKQQSNDFLEVLDNLTVSLDEIINRVHIKREPGMNPLFQVGFTFQEAPAELSFNNLRVEGLTLHSGGAMYDLHLWLWEDAGTIKGSLWYADEIFDDSTINNIIADFESLFAALVASPDKPVDQVIGVVSFTAHETTFDEAGGELNSAQQLFWFSEQFVHAGASQNLCSAWWADASVSADSLNQSLVGIVSKYPQLTQRLQTSVEGELPKFIGGDSVSLEVQVLSSDSRGDASKKLHDLMEVSFGLTSESLIKFFDIQYPDGSLVAAICHNILLDDVSLHRVVSEWLGCPEQKVEAEDRIQAHPYHRKPFWTSYVQDEWPALELIADHDRPAQFDHLGASFAWAVPESLHSKLQAFLAQQSVSAEHFWLALVEATLYRHTQQNVIGFGVSFPTIAQKAVGCHSDIMPYRAELSGDSGFAAIVQNTKQAINRLAQHRGISYQEILSYMKGEKDPTRTPLSQCFVSVKKVPQFQSSNAGNNYEKAVLGTVGARTDISFLVEYDENNTKLEIEYASSIYEQRSLQQLADHLAILLENVLNSPAQPLDLIEIMEVGERELLSKSAQGPNQQLAKNELVSMFAKSVEDHADSIAVRDQDTELTYQQLWDRAGSIASSLLAKGFSGQAVAMYMDRSVDMLAALLGVMRAGATYIPLDPDNPLDRLRIVIEDSGAKTCLTDSKQQSGLDGLGLPIDLLNVDDLKDTPFNEDIDQIAVDPMSMLYVIFTSGSTGRPKGVMVQHQAVVNFLNSMAREPGMVASDKLLATTTISFDIAVLELYLPLMVGAEVVLATRQQAMDGAQLQGLMDKHHITYLQATPTSWRILMATGWEGNQKMKALVGGEALTQDLSEQLVGKVSELWNMYGPTETTVWSTCQQVTADTASNCVGSAIDNTTVYILNPALKQQPVNVPGELCIGGLGVTLGYFDREELTADRFVTLPSGERVYRTGDLVHQGSDGRLYYHRRLDDQVKIRGYRIELGEIETRVRELTGVENAAVIVVGDTPVEHKLVAYLQPEMGAVLATDAMRTALADTLPSYMIPANFVEVAEIPRTSSGKVDKRALAEIPIQEKPQQHFELDVAATDLIKSQEEISEAVVVIDTRSQERICHYETLEDAYITIGALRKLARTELGADNAPRQFIEIRDWPTQEDGGVDWLALHEAGEGGDAPQTDMEKAVAAIWLSVLGTDSVRRSDNFFDVGGHSLLAVQVIMKIRTELGIEISQDRLLLNTLEVLSSECEKLSGEAAVQEPVENTSTTAGAGAHSQSESESDAPSQDQQDDKSNSSKGLFKKLFRRGS